MFRCALMVSRAEAKEKSLRQVHKQNFCAFVSPIFTNNAVSLALVYLLAFSPVQLDPVGADSPNHLSPPHLSPLIRALLSLNHLLFDFPWDPAHPKQSVSRLIKKTVSTNQPMSNHQMYRRLFWKFPSGSQRCNQLGHETFSFLLWYHNYVLSLYFLSSLPYLCNKHAGEWKEKEFSLLFLLSFFCFSSSPAFSSPSSFSFSFFSIDRYWENFKNNVISSDQHIPSAEVISIF